jgi:hypothetical protein
VTPRRLRLLLVALLIAGGWFYWEKAIRPDPSRLETWAQRALHDVFGPELTHGKVELDLLAGVRIRDLLVPGRDGGPALRAEVVDVQHDLLALSAGVLRLRRIVIRGPLISTHEDEKGALVLDFPFHLPSSGGRTLPYPEVVVEGGTFAMKAGPSSSTFKPGWLLVLDNFHVTATPLPGGAVRIAGGFTPKDVGLEGRREIAFEGSASPADRLLDVVATWDDMRLTPELRSILAPSLAEKLDPVRLDVGPHRLSVHLVRDPAVEAGKVRVVAQFEGRVRVKVTEMPFAESFDAKTLEELDRLLGRAEIRVQVSGTDVDVQALSSPLMGGEVRATGKIANEGKDVDLQVGFRGVRLDDPALRRAFGPAADELFETIEVRGRTDADVRLRREAGGPVEWESSIDLRDATLRYRGRPVPGKTTPAGNPMRSGFPYAVEHLNGRIRVGPGLVTLEGLEGRHGDARIRIRGAGEKARDGAETGTVRWDEKGAIHARVTVEIVNIAVDDDLRAAVEGSEIAGALDTYGVSGTVAGAVVDVRQEPGDPAAFAELEIDLAGASFAYREMPVPLRDVRGRVEMTRPARPGAAVRDQVVAADVEGTAAGGKGRVVADLHPIAERGRLRIWLDGASLDGEAAAVVASAPGAQGVLADLWHDLSPTGKASFFVDAPAYLDPAPPSFWARLEGVTVTLSPPSDAEPRPAVRLEGLRGAVRVERGVATIGEVTGTIGGRPLRAAGTAGGPGTAWDVEVRVDALEPSADVLGTLEGFAHGRAKALTDLKIEPGGRLDLAMRLRREAAEAGTPSPAPTVAVTVRNADLMARVGGIPVRVRGGLSVDGEVVTLEGLLVEGRGLSLRADHATFGPEGFAGEAALSMEGVQADDSLLALVPVSARDAVTALVEDRVLTAPSLVLASEGDVTTLRGGLTLQARPGAPSGGAPRGTLVFDPVRVAPDEQGHRALSGRLGLRGVSFDAGARITEADGAVEVESLDLGERRGAQGSLRLERARIGGVLVEALSAPVSRKGDVLAIGPIAASTYGGKLTGSFDVDAGRAPSFRGSLAVQGARLEAALADLAAEAGAASGTLEMEASFSGGAGGTLKADGTAFACGSLGELPAVSTIPALVSHLAEGVEKPRFTTATLEFSVQDDVVTARSIGLRGEIFDVCGSGTLTTSGDVDLTLRPQILKSFFLPGWQRIPVVGDVLALFREEPLYVVKICGKLEDPQTHVVVLPKLGTCDCPPEPGPRDVPQASEPPARRVPRWFR